MVLVFCCTTKSMATINTEPLNVNTSDSVRLQVTEGRQTLTICLYFYMNKSDIVKNYHNNQSELDKFDRFITQLSTANSQKYIRTITIRGACSFDGPYAYNERLAKSRAEATHNYLLKRYNNLWVSIKPNIATTPEE